MNYRPQDSSDNWLLLLTETLLDFQENGLGHINGFGFGENLLNLNRGGEFVQSDLAPNCNGHNPFTNCVLDNRLQ